MRRDGDDGNKVSTFVFVVNWKDFGFGLIQGLVENKTK